MKSLYTLIGITLLTVSLAACSSNKPSPTASGSPAATASSVAVEGGVLKLGEFNVTVTTEEQELVFSGAPDGQVEVDVDGEPHTIKVTAGGLLEIPSEGKPASIDATGTITLGDDASPVSVGEDGSIILDGKPFAKRDGDKYVDARPDDADKSVVFPAIEVGGDAGTERLVGFIVAYALHVMPGKETMGPSDIPVGEPVPAPTVKGE